ncbi:DUF3823 domain-containing protein [Fulvivirgaceae bacterium BMA10]|uniref:DUF3823 domain-containing protein n=1 Tax=Splendidivirga corallicola TaxID=3051826 RepID=A0ABT8KN50_9BACT|nr:DUF3823 domain-containing protein [Fulvivirgaceae bacterium BMA10]
MRKIVLIIFSFALTCFLGMSCSEIDNADPPSSLVEGTIRYNNEPVAVEQSQIWFNLIQAGFDFESDLPMAVDQDGNFSALLFNGDYRVEISGSAPYTFQGGAESVDLKVAGSQTFDIAVVPFFFIPENSVQYSISGNNLTATFTVEQPDATKTLDQVAVFVGDTRIVDGSINTDVVVESVPAGDLTGLTNIEVTVDISSFDKNYVFVRAGAQAAGAPWNYSLTKKMDK